MIRYILRRFLTMAVTLFMVILLTFALMHSVPGGPFTREKQVPPAVVEALEKKYKLDAPLYRQFFDLDYSQA